MTRKANAPGRESRGHFDPCYKHGEQHHRGEHNDSTG
jgi:hypothetical protein